MIAMITVHIAKQMCPFQTPKLILKLLPADEEMTIKKNWRSRKKLPVVPPSFTSAFDTRPLPTHLGLRIRDRPRRQKLLNHRRMPFHRSQTQRRVSILRRAASLR